MADLSICGGPVDLKQALAAGHFNCAYHFVPCQRSEFRFLLHSEGLTRQVDVRI